KNGKIGPLLSGRPNRQTGTVGRLGLHPGFAFLEKIDKFLNSNGTVNISFHDFLAAIERNLSGTAAYISKIGIGHFPGTIHDAPHDGNLYSLEMVSNVANFSSGFLEIKKSSSAGGTRNIFGLRDPGPRSLQDGKRSIVDELMIVVCLKIGSARYFLIDDLLGIIHQPDAITHSLQEECPGFS